MHSKQGLSGRHAQVILDKMGLPLRRLWCLFEISETPPEKLALVVNGASASEVAELFRDVRAAACGVAAVLARPLMAAMS